jgi:ribonuclease-3
VGFFHWLKNKKRDTFSDLEKVIDHKFDNRNLLKEALRHRSFIKDTGLVSNERLEFLGDAVLGVVVSAFLFEQNVGSSEGELTQMKAALVNETVLSQAALSFCLGDYLLMSVEEEKAGGRLRPSITADAFEALIGALYLDGGYDKAKSLVHKYILLDYQTTIESEHLHNYKGELLEYLQGKGLGMPYYKVNEEIGPDHDKMFVVGVYSNGNKVGAGQGHSKKEAEQKAAREAIIKLKNESPS